MSIGDIIKQYRAEHDLSTSEFAKSAGLSQAYINMLEHGKQCTTQKTISPSLLTLSKLATAMHITISDLLAAAEDSTINISKGTLTNTEKALIARFRCLNEDEQRIVLRSVGLTPPEEKGAVG